MGMLRCLRYLWIFQGKNPSKTPPIDFNRSEITDIVIIRDVPAGVVAIRTIKQ